jgi:hypothetical protein
MGVWGGFLARQIGGTMENVAVTGFSTIKNFFVIVQYQ